MSTPRWRPKSEIEWHRRRVGLANDLISSCSPSLNVITNLVQSENITKMFTHETTTDNCSTERHDTA